MRERLLENWLDRINERGYQAVFCQALSALGHTVVHSTRHGPGEQGKDIVSRDGAGNYHVYQLKGNPGTRLTVTQWNHILPQIHALMHQPVEPPLSHTAVLAEPYLVTNGEVDEEVHTNIRGLNSLASQNGRPQLKLISRGELLGTYLLPIADELWLQSTDVDQHILSCWGIDGSDFIRPQLFHEMLLSALPFSSPPQSVKSVDRALFGAAMINEICLRRFTEQENYVSKILGRGLFVAACYSFIEKAGQNPNSFENFRRLMWTTIVDDFLSLVKELENRKKRNFYDKDVPFEFVYHGHRLMMLKGLLAVFSVGVAVQPEAFSELSDDQRTFINDFAREFMATPTTGNLLGEYAIPQFLFSYWYTCRNSGYGVTDRMVEFVLRTLLACNASARPLDHLPGPYHLMPEILEERLLGLGRKFSFERETFRYQLWTALPLFGLLVRRNLKSTARSLFPDMTRYIHRTTATPDTWSFGLYRSGEAEEHAERLAFPGSWANFVQRTQTPISPQIPKGLTEDLITMSFFLILCPFRTTEEIVYHLDEILVGNWHRRVDLKASQ